MRSSTCIRVAGTDRRSPFPFGRGHLLRLRIRNAKHEHRKGEKQRRSPARYDHETHLSLDESDAWFE